MKTKLKKKFWKLNPRKSPGFDEIPSKIIKNSVTVLTSPLTNLFNISVVESVFPPDLQYANVTPFL